jgi:hypothetical protein
VLDKNNIQISRVLIIQKSKDICPKMVKTTENLCTGLLLEVRCQSLSSQDNKTARIIPIQNYNYITTLSVTLGSKRP